MTNATLAEQYRQYMIQYLGMAPEKMVPVDEAKVIHDVGGSSDFGSCSYLCPGIQAMFDIAAADAPHSVPFRDAAGSDLAHAEALRAAKANALISLDVLTNDGFAARVKHEWQDAMREAGRL